MATSGKATLHGLFSLKENVTLETFLPALEAYLRHLHAAGYVLRWRVEQRKVLGNFDRGLPDFTHYIAIEFPDLDTRRRVLSVRQRTDGTGPCPARGHVPAGPSRCTVFPHLRTGPAVNIGPGQVSCCGGAGPQAGQCPACQGRDTRLSAWPRSLCGLGAGECRP